MLTIEKQIVAVINRSKLDIKIVNRNTKKIKDIEQSENNELYQQDVLFLKKQRKNRFEDISKCEKELAELEKKLQENNNQV